MERNQKILAYLHLIEGHEEDELPFFYAAWTKQGESITDIIEPNDIIIQENIPLHDIINQSDNTSISDIQKLVDIIHGENMFLDLVCNLIEFGCNAMYEACHNYISKEEARFIAKNLLSAWENDLDVQHEEDESEDINDIKKTVQTIRQNYGTIGDDLLRFFIRKGLDCMNNCYHESELERLARLN